MAIKKRLLKDGSTRFTVQWTLGGGGTGPTASETFGELYRAQSFSDDVKFAGWQWPKGWVKGDGPTGASGVIVKDAPMFSDLAAAHFATQARRVKLGKKKAYTDHRERAMCAAHLEPTFGPLVVADIAAEDVMDWIDIQLDLGVAPKTIRNRHGLLFQIMSHAVATHMRPANPCLGIELPRSQDSRHIRFFQQDEWALLRSCLRPDIQLLFDVKLGTAMRIGEMLALRVGDCTVVDEELVHLHLVRAWSKRAPDDTAIIKFAEGEVGSWKLGPLKNRHSRHGVVMGQVARDLATAIAGRGADEYVFTTRGGAPWRYPDLHSDRWQPAVIDAKARGLTKHATMHMLRHTCAVWAMANGVPVQVVSEMLGHASIQITYDVYGGLINVFDAQMAQAMAKSLLSVSQLTVSGPSVEEVMARKIRPGSRREKRPRGHKL